MTNHREKRQANYRETMSLAMLYTRLASIWHRSDKYTLDKKYNMCLEADRISDGLREKASRMYD